jgi:hypothetical protein
MAAEVHTIIRCRKNQYGGFLINGSVPTTFCGAATRSLCSTNHSPSRYTIMDRLP